MKKSITILSAFLAILSVMAFGFLNWNDTEPMPITETVVSVCKKEVVKPKPPAPKFFYDINSRYRMTMTKKELNEVSSLADIIAKDDFDYIVDIHSVSVEVKDAKYKTLQSATGESYLFTEAQLQLIKTAPYSTNLLIKASFKEKDKFSGALYEGYTTPHITVVPEKQAVYSEGKGALMAYLKENSQEQTSIVEEGWLEPGKIHFTITSDGSITNTKLTSTSGYTSIDQTMIELISNIPGQWEPAQNSEGEAVDQELVFSFGNIGC